MWKRKEDDDFFPTWRDKEIENRAFWYSFILPSQPRNIFSPWNEIHWIIFLLFESSVKADLHLEGFIERSRGNIEEDAINLNNEKARNFSLFHCPDSNKWQKWKSTGKAFSRKKIIPINDFACAAQALHFIDENCDEAFSAFWIHWKAAPEWCKPEYPFSPDENRFSKSL